MKNTERFSRLLRSRRMRALSAAAFLLLAVSGLAVHSGWGTASAFGPWDIAALCPLGAIEVMAAGHAFIPRVLAGLLVAVVVCVVLGRVFCGWLCPVPLVGRFFGRKDAAGRPSADGRGGCTHDCRTCRSACGAAPAGVPEPAAASGEHRRGITLEDAGPYAVLAGAIGSSAIFGFPVFCLVCPVGLTFAVVIALWRVFEFNELSWSILFFAGFLTLELLVLRRWCHRFCPLGAVMTLLARLNRTYRPTVDRTKCLRSKGLDCNVCRSVCPEGLSLAGAAGPDGRVSAGLAAARCTKCRACADACPAHAIRFPLLPERAEGTPAPAPKASVPRAPQPPEILSREEIRMESARCIECGACAKACPAGKDIPGWMVLLRENAFDAASRRMLAPGAFPEICGRICPAERLCESVCPVPAETGGPIPIQKLERSVVAPVMAADALGDRILPRIPSSRRGVAIVGTGPAGLACAEALLALNVPVTLFDGASEIGGLLTWGIPAFKLEKRLLTARRRSLERAGAEFRLGRRIGSGEHDVRPESLTQDFCAVFLAIGAGSPVDAGIPGEDAAGVLQAGEFLAACAREALPVRHDGLGRAMSSPADLPPAPNLLGRHVVVIGAGDTAVDCLRSALARGAADAVCLVRREHAAMRALPSEAARAEREGARFLFRTTATRIDRHPDGSVRGIAVEDLAAGTTAFLPCDVVISACGFRPEAPDWLAALGIEADARGRIPVKPGMRTSNPMVFAGGDAVRGPSLAVHAFTDGREAARTIAAELGIRKSLPETA